LIKRLAKLIELLGFSQVQRNMGFFPETNAPLATKQQPWFSNLVLVSFPWIESTKQLLEFSVGWRYYNIENIADKVIELW